MNARQSIRATFLVLMLSLAAFAATTAAAEWAARDFGITWGRGFFHGPRFGWGVPGSAYGHPYFGGCVLKRLVDDDGDVVVRHICL